MWCLAFIAVLGLSILFGKGMNLLWVTDIVFVILAINFCNYIGCIASSSVWTHLSIADNWTYNCDIIWNQFIPYWHLSKLPRNYNLVLTMYPQRHFMTDLRLISLVANHCCLDRTADDVDTLAIDVDSLPQFIQSALSDSNFNTRKQRHLAPQVVSLD